MSFRSHILKSFRSILPPISQTEREALESGTVGWDGELMKGAPDWKKLFDIPKMELTAEETAFLNGPVEEFCAMLDNWQIHNDNDLPPAVWDYIKKSGLMGLEIPKEYGGHGFSSQLHSAAVIKIASRSIAAAVTVMVPNSLGPGELIHQYGTKEQKDYYLPRLAKGDEIPCFALTSPDAGSDAGSISDNGVVCRNDKGEIGIRLNWEKRYITLGPVATLIGMAFKLYDPDNLLGRGEKDLGITVALVPRNTPGVEIGDRHAPMDLAFQNGPNRGHDVFIPLSNIIGGAEMAGQGWRMLMECLAVGRALSLPALSTAGAKLSAHATGAYARVRKQFNSPIAKFEGIEEPLARIAGLTYLMNGARVATLQMVDGGERPAIPSAILKYHLTENMRTIVNDAMDVHGGKAIVNGPNNIFADLYKGIPVAITVEGANIMTRSLIIFGQGAVRAHPYVLKELEAVNEPDEKIAFNKLVKTVAAHAGGAVVSLFKSLFFGLTYGFGSPVPDVHPATAKYYRQINRQCAAFNLATEAALATLGGGLKRRERISARLGDVFSNLYLASTTLWYFEKEGRREEDLPLLHWATTHALSRAEHAFDEMMRNHPNRIAGLLLRPFIFPLGRHMSAPSDKMDVAAADCIRNPGEVRNRLTDGIFKPLAADQPLLKLEKAFAAVIEAEAVEKKIYKAAKSGQMQDGLPRARQLDAAKDAGVITAAEYDIVMLAERLRRDVIMVDAFPQKKKAESAASKAA
jgi:acyl-CoA dehydrogenase